MSSRKIASHLQHFVLSVCFLDPQFSDAACHASTSVRKINAELVLASLAGTALYGRHESSFRYWNEHRQVTLPGLHASSYGYGVV